MERTKRVLQHLTGGDTGSQSTSKSSADRRDYLYTVNGVADRVLTPEQRDFYEENGFLVVENLVGDDEIQTYNDRFQEICDGRTQRDVMMIVMKDIALIDDKQSEEKSERVITKIQNWENDDTLMGYARHPEVLHYIEAFTGPDVNSVHSMLIHKPPDVGKGTSRHPLHQDQYYFPFGPPERTVCAWTAMQHINRANGCLAVIPGSHKRSPGGKLLAHGYPDWEHGANKMYYGIKTFDTLNITDDLVHLEMEKGSTVFFHPLLIHGSGMNRTKGFRKAISIHYASTHCTYHDLKGTVQEPLLAEAESVSKRKLGFAVPYNAAYKAKMRLVRGKADTL